MKFLNYRSILTNILNIENHSKTVSHYKWHNSFHITYSDKPNVFLTIKLAARLYSKVLKLMKTGVKKVFERP